MKMGLLAGVMAAALSAAAPALAAGKLYFGISGEPSTLDPSINAGTHARTVRLAIHRGLLNYGVDGKLSNELATGYEVSADGREYTFRLREAKFHDNTPVTAEDVKFSFERIIGPDSRATYKSELSVIESIEVVDSRTVRFRLRTAFVPFPHYLALPESAVIPKAWAERNASNPNAMPVGAGPFRMTAWQRGQQITVQRFAGYYKPNKPSLDEVNFVFAADENTRVNAIRSGDVDIIDYVPWKDAAALERERGIRLESTTGPFMVLQFNTRSEPFSKPEVRQALAYAINRDAIIQTAFNGRGTPIYGLAIPAGYPGHSPAIENHFSYDPARAKALLAQAGYPNGFRARLVSTSQFGFHMNTAIVVKSELEKIGITVDLDMPDWSGRMAKATSGDYDFMVSGTAGDITDADWLSNFFYGGSQLVRLNNSPYFDDPEINRLLDEGRVTLDPAARGRIYDAFAKRALELSPFVYLMWRDQSYAVRSNVSGFTNMPGFLSFQSGFSVENVQVR